MMDAISFIFLQYLVYKGLLLDIFQQTCINAYNSSNAQFVVEQCNALFKIIIIKDLYMHKIIFLIISFIIFRAITQTVLLIGISFIETFN